MALHNGSYRIRDVSSIIPSLSVYLSDDRVVINTLLFDSRKLIDTAGGLFFALKGRRDGHAYVGDVYAAGVRNFVIGPDKVDIHAFPEANFIVVQDPLEALQILATHNRNLFTKPVIGITGSNGKTIVKEWLAQLLGPDYRVVRSPKSYNSQLGVALSLWQLNDSFDLAIIEAGISQPGEMDMLRRMIKPDIAVLTNIGPAHDDGFADRRIKISEKIRLFEDAGLVVYSPAHVEGVTVPVAPRRITWGNDNVDLVIKKTETIGGGRSRIQGYYAGQPVEIVIPFTDAASQENAVCCWAVLLALGYTQSVVADRMAHLQAVEMRLEMKEGINGCTVVDDSYSNDLASLAIALDFLRQQQQHQARTLILSDIPGAGGHEASVYSEVAKLLKENKISRLITVGPELMKCTATFSFLPHEAFPDTESFLSASVSFGRESILLKGARRFAFERISRLLTAKRHNTILEINLSALEHNLNQFRALLDRDVKIMAMVKAFSYGSGDVEVANLMQFNKVDYLTVAYVDEGITLRKAGIELPIMVMSPDTASFDALVSNRLEPEVYSIDLLKSLIRFLEEEGIEHYPVHIKVDTGMHRLGIVEKDIDWLASILSSSNAVKVQSLFSHLSAAGDPHYDAFTHQQLTGFVRIADRLQGALGYRFLRHIANTAAILRWPQAHLDMVRLGIGLYGIGEKEMSDLVLQPSGTLKTVITQIRCVPGGDSVGYGRKGMCEEDRIVATVNIGYADGYDRRFGNGVGRMFVNGQAAPTVGDICMDMTMLDITGIPAAAGDEVIVFGDICEEAELIGTIPYELLSRISHRVKRVYYYA